jgi:chromosome segregation ATPase
MKPHHDNNNTKKKKGGLFVSSLWGGKTAALVMLGSAVLAAPHYLLSSFPKTHAATTTNADDVQAMSAGLAQAKAENERLTRGFADENRAYERALEMMEKQLQALQLQLTQKRAEGPAGAVDLTRALEENHDDELRAELTQLKTKVATLDADKKTLEVEKVQMLAEMNRKDKEWAQALNDAGEAFAQSEQDLQRELDLTKADLEEKQRQNDVLNAVCDKAQDALTKERERSQTALETATNQLNTLAHDARTSLEEHTEILRRTQRKRDAYKEENEH